MQDRQNKKKKFLDIGHDKERQNVTDFRHAMKNQTFAPTLFSRGRITKSFFTEDSKLYITPKEQVTLRKGIVLDRKTAKWDSLSSRVVNEFVRYQPSASSLLLDSLEKRCETLNGLTEDAVRSFSGQFSMVRLWNASIVGSILFGMVMMTFVYRYLGQGAEASASPQQQTSQSQQQILDVAIEKSYDDAESFAKQVAEIQKAESRESLEREMKQMVKGYPIEKMIPYIAEQDRTVAAFIIAIARKESAWGRRVPVLNGQDCYNYWGYRGQRKLMGSGGHTCFNSPKDAVDTVAKRIETLVNEKGKDTPAKMVLWKCGSDCNATGGQAAANKWISDVDDIFQRFDTQD